MRLVCTVVVSQQNIFTPENVPEQNQWFYINLPTMCSLTGASPILVEQISDKSPSLESQLVKQGYPVGRSPVVEVRNTHMQYIFTWWVCVCDVHTFFAISPARRSRHHTEYNLASYMQHTLKTTTTTTTISSYIYNTHALLLIHPPFSIQQVLPHRRYERDALHPTQEAGEGRECEAVEAGGSVKHRCTRSDEDNPTNLTIRPHYPSPSSSLTSASASAPPSASASASTSSSDPEPPSTSDISPSTLALFPLGLFPCSIDNTFAASADAHTRSDNSRGRNRCARDSTFVLPLMRRCLS
ncbi:hypothetical protein BC936DRAFT_147342 [Jimgerdemannia flammicorona]|uniref:SURF1-like protein n=1 Tax=Jimgerdemannia flammicorona TaxID=994334 RepID=A0A433D5Q1_9FUNG|nr:hypothetical protein BC936DRAFT_147342 [Jimgerdemannia flammicorona]